MFLVKSRLQKAVSLPVPSKCRALGPFWATWKLVLCIPPSNARHVVLKIYHHHLTSLCHIDMCGPGGLTRTCCSKSLQDAVHGLFAPQVRELRPCISFHYVTSRLAFLYSKLKFRTESPFSLETSVPLYFVQLIVGIVDLPTYSCRLCRSRHIRYIHDF